MTTYATGGVVQGTHSLWTKNSAGYHFSSPKTMPRTWTWGNHIHLVLKACARSGWKKGATVTGQVYNLTEGDWFVRGETETEKVAALLEDHEIVTDEMAPEDEDWEIHFTRFDKGWWRFVPCSPRMCGEHSWHLFPAKGPGRGAFEGVYCEFDVRAVSYGIDDDVEFGVAWRQTSEQGALA